MLMQGDIDLNSVEIYTDSLKDLLKQTMLEQDVMFRNQVLELHRLYRTQRRLMVDLGQNKFESCNPWKESTQSTVMPLTYPRRYDTLAKETTYSSISTVGSAQSLSQDFSEGRCGEFYKLQKRPLDFQLPAAQYLGHADEDLPMNGNIWNHLQETMELKHPFHGGNISDSEDLKLSLSIGTKRKCVPEKTSYSQNFIDLEQEYERIPDEGANDVNALGCSALPTYFGGKDESQVSVLSDQIIPRSAKNDPAHSIADGSYLVDGRECFQVQNSFSQGLKSCPGGMPCNNQSTKKQDGTLNKAGLVDLNKVLLDDSSCYSNDPMMAYPSTASSSSIFNGLVGGAQEGSSVPMTQRKQNHSIVNSYMLQQDDAANLDLVDFNSKYKRIELCRRNAKLDGSNLGIIGCQSASRSSLGLCEDLGSHSSHLEKENVVSTLELTEGVHCPNQVSLATRQLSDKKGEAEAIVFSHSDRSQDTVQDWDGNQSPASCKSHSNPENDVSSVKTKGSVMELGNSGLSISDKFSGTHIGLQVAETPSVEMDRRSSDSSEVKLECHKNKRESAKVDVLIQSAAESLIHISLESSASLQESSTREGSNEVQNEELKEQQPEYSSDSYEAIALKLTESNEDDYSVTSKPFEVNDSEMKDFGFKLRRGRRLKDFQKEILPGLASLARHEICEDINIMEGVLRSREYRRMRAKMGDGESWSSPLSGKRSRGKNAGRRKRR